MNKPSENTNTMHLTFYEKPVRQTIGYRIGPTSSVAMKGQEQAVPELADDDHNAMLQDEEEAHAKIIHEEVVVNSEIKE